MELSPLVPDTQAWMIFFKAKIATFSLLDLLVKGYNVYVAHKVLEEIATKKSDGFPELYYFIRSNIRTIKQIDRYNVALQKCQTFTESALVFLAKKLESETQLTFKQIMSYFDKGETNAIAHCLFLSRVGVRNPIFITQDDKIIRPLQELFYMHQIGQVVRCDHFISSLELQIQKSPEIKSLFSAYGIMPSNIRTVSEPWIEVVERYSKTVCDLAPWCQSYAFNLCWERPCIS